MYNDSSYSEIENSKIIMYFFVKLNYNFAYIPHVDEIIQIFRDAQKVHIRRKKFHKLRSNWKRTAYCCNRRDDLNLVFSWISVYHKQVPS